MWHRRRHGHRHISEAQKDREAERQRERERESAGGGEMTRSGDGGRLSRGWPRARPRMTPTPAAPPARHDDLLLPHTCGEDAALDPSGRQRPRASHRAPQQRALPLPPPPFRSTLRWSVAGTQPRRMQHEVLQHRAQICRNFAQGSAGPLGRGLPQAGSATMPPWRRCAYAPRDPPDGKPKAQTFRSRTWGKHTTPSREFTTRSELSDLTSRPT